MLLTSDQLTVFQKIQANPCGVHVISGVPGAGKTLMAKALTVYFESTGKQILLCAWTGPAACRLSHRALTAHSTFLIPASGPLPVLPPSHPMFQRILAADVILIDEFSMITSHLFNMIMYRIKQVCNTAGCNIKTKLIILLGDPAQLPPVCHHQTCENDVCAQCHITASPFWPLVTKHFLSSSVRHVADPDYINFLQFVRNGQVTQELIDDVLGDRMFSPLHIASLADENTTYICTHRQDVASINNTLLKLRCSSVVDLHMKHNCDGDADMQKWACEPDFHLLSQASVGAPVILTTNIDLSLQACNGATGVITNFKTRQDGDVYAIQVKLDTGADITLYRMMYKIRFHGGKRYFKATWPLSLAYAITGHKVQGATIKGKVCLVI